MKLLSRWWARLTVLAVVVVVVVAATVKPSHGAAPRADVASPGASYDGWVDLAGAATFETVDQLATWEPFEGWKSWGYGLEPVWLRVAVPAASSLDQPPQILVVRPPFLDRVTFYDPAFDGLLKAGDFWPAADDALGSVLFTFKVPPSPVARYLWIRIESSSTRIVHLSLMPLAQAQLTARWVEWATGSAVVLSAVLAVWALAQWRVSRGPITGFFALKQIVMTLWGFLFLGFARLTVGPLFPEGVLSLIGSIVVAVVVSSILWFFAALLVEYGARPRMLRALHASAWIILGLGLLNFVGLSSVSLNAINAVAPFVLLLIVLAVWTAQPGERDLAISKTALLAYLAFYVVLNAIPAMTYTGLIPESPILFVGNMSLMVADGAVMMVMLNKRQRWMREQHQAITTQLMVQEGQARLNQQYLEEQRQLLSMLAHEMKTPLANLRIWMEAGEKGRAAMERAIQDMSRVIERCVHAGQLSDKTLEPRCEWFDAVELTQTVLRSSRQPERVRLESPDTACALYADAQMLSIVLSNLLENAYKYGASETPVSVRISAVLGPEGQPGWRWQVDNEVGASGFPDPGRLFEKYYRSLGAQRQSGSGLGLYLVKSLLTLMQGQIRYERLAQRVRFEIWMPVKAAPQQHLA